MGTNCDDCESRTVRKKEKHFVKFLNICELCANIFCMKLLCDFFKVFVAVSLTASFGLLTAFGSSKSYESTTDGNESAGGHGTSTTRHLKSVILVEGRTPTTTTRVYDNFIYDAANRVTAVTETAPKSINNYQYSYSLDKVICTHNHASVDGYGWEETVTFLIENGLVTEELWDGSQIKYEYTNGMLSSIDDPGYSSAIYERNDDGSLHSFTRNKKRKDPYTTTFSYGGQPYNGPLLFIGIAQVDPWCMEGTEFCWPLQLSGLFGDMTPGNLPETVSIDGRAPVNITFNQDSEGYITELIVHSSTPYTLTYVWEMEGGVDDIPYADLNTPAVYYDLNGIQVNGDALAPGLYIKCQGGSATKWHVK